MQAENRAPSQVNRRVRLAAGAYAGLPRCCWIGGSAVARYATWPRDGLLPRRSEPSGACCGGGVPMRLFCFGFGYAAEALARRLSARTTALAGTRTRLQEDPPPLGARLGLFQSDGASQEVRSLLSGTTHVLVSIPPDLEGDGVLRHFRDDL